MALARNSYLSSDHTCPPLPSLHVNTICTLPSLQIISQCLFFWFLFFSAFLFAVHLTFGFCICLFVDVCKMPDFVPVFELCSQKLLVMSAKTNAKLHLHQFQLPFATNYFALDSLWERRISL